MNAQRTPTEDPPSNGQTETPLRPPASSEAARLRMRSVGQRDTRAELRIRKLLHASGLRYLTDAKPLECSPRRADIVFRGAKVAIFVDGCFWHGCPDHGTWPQTNAGFWREKIRTNRARDIDTNERLEAAGWRVIRVWEHADRTEAAASIARAIRESVHKE
jgi:DNA mismatch endonuclease (patch repair protein)